MIKFAHNEYFILLLILAVFIAYFFVYRSWVKKAWSEFGDKSVIASLMPEVSASKSLFKFILVLLATLFLIVGIIDPQIGSKLKKVKREGIDLYLVLDVSNSMLAEDIKPNRLERSKLAISSLVDKLEGDRVGIIIFAGNAYKQLPLTTDYSAVKLFLSAVDTKIVPTQGTAIGEAIEMATVSFGETEHNKAIIVITDGENHEDDAIEAAKNANDLGINVFTIGMGLPEGAPIPIYNKYGSQTGYKKDRSNKTVITKLNEDMLRQIAAAGGGAYARANNASTGLKRIFNDINEIDKKEIETRQFSDYEDRFQVFLGIALFLIVLELLIADRKTRWIRKFDFFGK
ncbi:MAG: VWA domain-containing protein [Bacteroidales bacterium]|nr:VWA domain-containing protein [Bacteroidales bacterium]MDG2081036.1 VWA domain-containing protein [Bacteroidales bacterium]